MKPRPSIPLMLTLAAALAASCSAGASPPQATAAPEVTTLGLVTLPPAWTATPSETFVPPTATTTPTPPAAVVAARQTAASWPPLVIVAVGAGADQTDWQTVEWESGSMRLPPSFEIADRDGYDTDVVRFIQTLAGGLVETMEGRPTPAPGEPTPTPIALGELESTFDFLVAADPGGEASVVLIGEPRPEGFDLETMMVEAVGSVQGEVTLLDREIVGGAPHDAGRVLMSVRDPASGVTRDQVLYVIVEGDRAWTLAFQARDLPAMLAAFETSALSLSPP
jgi:hypothetical protein